jgi:hypothetical protein
LTTLAGAVNGAVRAKDAKTLVTTIRAADAATRRLNQTIPGLKESVKSSPKLAGAIKRVNSNLSSLKTSVNQAKQAAARAQFRATGGTIKPAPAYKPDITTVLPRTYRTGAPRPAAYSKPASITITPPKYNSTYTYTTKKLVAKLQKLKKALGQTGEETVVDTVKKAVRRGQLDQMSAVYGLRPKKVY